MIAAEGIGRLSAGALSVLVHASFVAILLFSLDYSSVHLATLPDVEPIQAVVVDEAQISSQVEGLKAAEATRKENERERQRQLRRSTVEGHRTPLL